MKRFKYDKKLRLLNYNYAADGVYFITICTAERRHLFGKTRDGEMIFSELGEIAYNCWLEIPTHFSYSFLDQFVIMPDHMHGLVIIDNSEKIGQLTDPTEISRHLIGQYKSSQCGSGQVTGLQPSRDSLSIIIRTYKAAVTTESRRLRLATVIWQSRFYDRIVRNHKELSNIRNYILQNPVNW